MSAPYTLLVIPSYRDGVRLAAFLPGLCAELAHNAGAVLVQPVDDGSPPAEQNWLAAEIDRLRPRYPFLQPLLTHAVNRGKGQAIRTGWATGPGARWLAFADADGAAPAAEVVSLIERARTSPRPAVFIAERTGRQGKPVTRFWYRRAGSRVFNAWVKFCLGLDVPDTQCGLKVIPAALHAGGGWREEGFAFDLELLLRARDAGLPVVAQPISWSERPGSSLSPRAMLALFAAAWRLRPSRAAK